MDRDLSKNTRTPRQWNWVDLVCTDTGEESSNAMKSSGQTHCVLLRQVATRAGERRASGFQQAAISSFSP